MQSIVDQTLRIGRPARGGDSYGVGNHTRDTDLTQFRPSPRIEPTRMPRLERNPSRTGGREHFEESDCNSRVVFETRGSLYEYDLQFSLQARDLLQELLDLAAATPQCAIVSYAARRLDRKTKGGGGACAPALIRTSLVWAIER
jgi:hypothetical protein